MDRRKKAERRGSSTESLTVKDCKILAPDGIREVSILIKDGKISKVQRRISETTSRQVDGKGLLALPGLIDVHVHLRGMQLSYKEDFTSGTAAAAAGGFTSVLDMPNTRPVTDSPERLKEKMGSAEERVLVNVGFHAAATTDSLDVRKMTIQGAFSLKLYLPHPLSPMHVESDEEILGLMRTAGRNGIPVTVHAEEATLIDKDTGAKNYLDLARTRPPGAESKAVLRILRLQKFAKCSVHFSHLTLPSSLQQVRNMRSSKVSSEVTPHHLLLSENDLKRSGWRAWMVPPLRRSGVCRKLLELVAGGRASLVASDHAPHSVDEKQAGLSLAPPGIPGLETTLPLLLTLVDKGVLSLRRIVELLCANPARLFGLPSKGSLANGMDGDVVLVDLKRRGRIKPEDFLSKAKYSPFEGFETRGGVVATIVGGEIVYDHDEVVAQPGSGKVLRRGR